ncbi:hypothetical protein BJ322DRAFT_153080 [Thelephora terrestris]|uniref:Zn(2)-C6 fungal-type domain-containing protein n=1 Tax=Thelephora terrestris TaxID=56493 RepID=A0A9P6HDM5_9AGAM|nr:hypothetical protein BJ322DRAFT_153080 [Thelephora terrestris]
MAARYQGACMACRARKVKCIPGPSGCTRCTEVGIPDCHYTLVKKRGVGNTLRMGQACIPCRQKKIKCDARQPCATCVNRDRVAACTYERSRSSKSVLRASLDSSSGSASSHSSSANLLERSSTPPNQLELKLSLRAPRKVAPVPSSNVSLVGEVPGSTEHPPRPTASSFTVLPSIHFQTIPRPLRIPLSAIHPEHSQVSCVARNDLDMAFRLRALCQLNRLGLYFTREKQEAITRGDTSNSVLDRYFVDGVQAMGMPLCGFRQGTPAMVQLQARYIQRAWESFVQLKQTNSERVIAQALVLLTQSFITLGLNKTAQFYLLKACKIIEKEKLGFPPEHGPPAEFSERVREEASVLSQTIYLENYCYLALGGPAPVKTARIEREFRLDLQVRSFFILLT